VCARAYLLEKAFSLCIQNISPFNSSFGPYLSYLARSPNSPLSRQPGTDGLRQHACICGQGALKALPSKHSHSPLRTLPLFSDPFPAPPSQQSTHHRSHTNLNEKPVISARCLFRTSFETLSLGPFLLFLPRMVSPGEESRNQAVVSVNASRKRQKNLFFTSQLSPSPNTPSRLHISECYPIHPFPISPAHLDAPSRRETILPP
jgi:hypothetical protein